MCGQAGIHRRRKSRINDINELADALLREIEYRGRHATGYLAMQETGRVQVEKTCVPASKFVRGRKRFPVNAKTVLLHTRYATVGKQGDPRNAHPQISGRVAAVHNGTIRNATEIFRAFDLPRKAEVDSEVIPALLDHAGWENAREAFDLFQGGAAFAAVTADRPDEVILARTVNYPMVYMVTDDLVIWASTEDAIRAAWRRVYGRRPIGVFYSLAAWSMVRINGEVTVSTIRKYTPPPVPKRRYASHAPKRTAPKPKRTAPKPRQGQSLWEVLTTGGTTYQCLATDAADATRKANDFGWVVKEARQITKPRLAPTTGSKRAKKKARKRHSKERLADVRRQEIQRAVCASNGCENPYDYLGLADEDGPDEPDDALTLAAEDLMDEGFSHEEAWTILDAERDLIEEEFGGLDD